ncbi:hypothetical protein CHS0354_006853 [Potamilus streckersoni]|uniref:Uncharacterized protein n=1 Tax=Potamilus streckersoni TaxID=2493646 RepID=A0AAE0TEA9_9BIVA|nr:hypothetical protein CHS0354_006853 [Potamilus streckersoni]
MDKHCDNARHIAESLAKDMRLKKVLYPFLPSHPGYTLAKKQMKQGGALLTIELPGGSQILQRAEDDFALIQSGRYALRLPLTRRPPHIPNFRPRNAYAWELPTG